MFLFWLSRHIDNGVLVRQLRNQVQGVTSNRQHKDKITLQFHYNLIYCFNIFKTILDIFVKKCLSRMYFLS